MYIFLTYTIKPWWCRMQTFNLAWKLHIATEFSCPSPCPCWGVMFFCLISNMAAFNLSSWLQVTAINVVTRAMKPCTTHAPSTAAKHCKELVIITYICFKWSQSTILIKQFQLSQLTLWKWHVWRHIVVF
jgi:hypothetical protein